MKYAYIIVLERDGEDDYGPEATDDHGDDKGTHHDGSDAAAITQVAKELQEAMDISGLPAVAGIPKAVA